MTVADLSVCLLLESFGALFTAESPGALPVAHIALRGRLSREVDRVPWC